MVDEFLRRFGRLEWREELDCLPSKSDVLIGLVTTKYPLPLNKGDSIYAWLCLQHGHRFETVMYTYDIRTSPP